MRSPLSLGSPALLLCFGGGAELTGPALPCCSDRWRTVTSNFGLPLSGLSDELNRMQDPAQCDKITKINATLDETKEEVVRPQALAPLLTGYCRQRGSHTIAPWPFAAPLAGQDY